MQGDSSVMGTFKANDYLESHRQDIKNDPLWPYNDSNIRVCDIPLKSKYDTVSYALGYAWCRGAYGIGISKVTPALIIGLSKGIKGDTTIFSYQTADKYLRAYVEELRVVKFADIKKKNEQWLEANKKNPGIITLANGIQYKIIKSGKGKSPSNNDIVECNYIFKLIDGTILENSYETQQPKKFYLFGVIKGLAEAVQLMKEGDKWEIYIPYNLAYGSGGTKGQIPPYGTVIYELELLKVSNNN
jgi:FKBP-type peptidyl-prolyl cis-trans isomerase FklB